MDPEQKEKLMKWGALAALAAAVAGTAYALDRRNKKAAASLGWSTTAQKEHRGTCLQCDKPIGSAPSLYVPGVGPYHLEHVGLPPSSHHVPALPAARPGLSTTLRSAEPAPAHRVESGSWGRHDIRARLASVPGVAVDAMGHLQVPPNPFRSGSQTWQAFAQSAPLEDLRAVLHSDRAKLAAYEAAGDMQHEAAQLRTFLRTQVEPALQSRERAAATVPEAGWVRRHVAPAGPAIAATLLSAQPSPGVPASSSSALTAIPSSGSARTVAAPPSSASAPTEKRGGTQRSPGFVRK